jgi:hypothetical protein
LPSVASTVKLKPRHKESRLGVQILVTFGFQGWLHSAGKGILEPNEI